MFFKIFKKTCIAIFLSLFIMPSIAFAYSDYLIPGGENIGIELNAKGIMVVGLYKAGNSYPARDAGIQIGDIIQKVNMETVSDIDEMVQKINDAQDKENIQIDYMRNGKQKKTQLKLYKDENNIYKTGLYVKDSISGIGTLSFIDPNTKIFGALGHEIAEKTTGKILDIKDGKIFDSVVTSIERSKNGTPGEKNARLTSDKEKGIIKENTISGIFGTYTENLPNKKQYKVANPSDITLGSAKILTVLNGNEVKEYNINIIKINQNQKTKNMLFEIADQELLSKTGGVVQGMSGSPIIQGDLIIGAVTHVVIDEPKKGYGIFITNMLEEAEN